MSETAQAWLTDLTSFYTPTSTQFDAAKSHRASIEGRLDSYLGLHEMLEIGSLRHGTGVWQYSDADFLASPKGGRPDSPWTMLNKVKDTLHKVKDTLQNRFPSTPIVVRRPGRVPILRRCGGGFAGIRGGFRVVDRRSVGRVDEDLPQGPQPVR
jgi:hypothetical protein